MTRDNEVELIDLEPQPAVVLALSADAGEATAAFGTAIGKVRAAVAAARVPAAGPPFVRYLGYGERIEMEVGLPLDGPHSVPTLRTTILPGGAAASLWRIGSHPGLEEALHLLERWVEDNATPAAAPWEVYWTEPDADPPRTQLVWPVERP